MNILAMKGNHTFLVRLNENEAALVNLEDDSVFFDEKGARFLRSGIFIAPVYDDAMQEKMLALITKEHDKNELRELLIRFATSGLQELAEASKEYLNEKMEKEALIPVLESYKSNPDAIFLKFEENMERALELLKK